MKSFLFGLLLTMFFPASVVTQAVCRSAKATNETTKWGGNHWNVLKEEMVYRSINGSIRMWVDDSSLENALVELYDQPDYLLCERLPNNPNGCSTQPPDNQRRIAACLTGENGNFGFDGLRAGNYELRVSAGAGWNVEHIFVNVDPKKGQSKRIRIAMTVGD